MKQRTLAMMTGFEQYTRKTRRAIFLEEMEQGVRITTGTIVDATILHAPTSTKNREQQRDPEMHQTRKGKQWYFGMKAHVRVDSKTKIIHTAVATAANVADSVVLPDLLHGEETRVWGDQAYRGQTEVIRECAPQAQDCTHRRYRYKDGVDEVERAKNRTKSRVRSKVEHVFAVMKLKFGFVKLGYRGAEECHPTVRGVRAGESVLGAEKTVALGTGLARERRLLITGEPPKQAEDRKKPNPSACTGLAEHLLPRRHGLIQSFPK